MNFGSLQYPERFEELCRQLLTNLYSAVKAVNGRGGDQGMVASWKVLITGVSALHHSLRLELMSFGKANFSLLFCLSCLSTILPTVSQANMLQNPPTHQSSIMHSLTLERTCIVKKAQRSELNFYEKVKGKILRYTTCHITMDMEKIKAIEQLVMKYRKDYANNEKSFNEHAVRQGFILPLLKMLGWEPDNPQEIYPEDLVKGVGLVDFSLRLNNMPIIYIETKRFSESLDGRRSDGKTYVDQALEYAWKHPTTSISWVVLTNFKELRLYNAKEHKLVFSVTCDKFCEEYDAKLHYLEKDAVQNGEIGYLYSLVVGVEIDKNFLLDLLEWRVAIANDILTNNTNLDIYSIKETSQTLIDRLILIRISEDKGKIPRGWLKNRFIEWQKTTLNKTKLVFSKD